MKGNRLKEEKEICHYILAYLSENPDAGDTLEGIAEWWLRNQMIKFEIQTVSQAVANLIAEGLIVERKGYDSRSIYKIK